MVEAAIDWNAEIILDILAAGHSPDPEELAAYLRATDGPIPPSVREYLARDYEAIAKPMLRSRGKAALSSHSWLRRLYAVRRYEQLLAVFTGEAAPGPDEDPSAYDELRKLAGKPNRKGNVMYPHKKALAIAAKEYGFLNPDTLYKLIRRMRKRA